MFSLGCVLSSLVVEIEAAAVDIDDRPAVGVAVKVGFAVDVLGVSVADVAGLVLLVLVVHVSVVCELIAMI